ITNLTLRASKRGNRFATFDLIDFYGSGECVLFGTLLEQKGELIKNDTLVYVQAKADENGDSIKLVIEDIMPIEKLKERFSENIVINIFEKEDDVFDKLERIHALAENHPGNCKLFFNVINNGSSQVWKSREFKLKPSMDLISNLKEIVGESNLKIN